MKKAVVTGAGGFIAGHLVVALKEMGYQIRAVDKKPLNHWYQVSEDVENLVLDLNFRESCYKAVNGYNEVFNLAADMGGMGFIETHKAECMLSVLINTHMLVASKDCGIERFFFASSACVYNGEKQTDPENPGLKESDAYPALAEDGYGWEKLFSERMCRHFREDFGLITRVARFHNVYGPSGTYDGGREKAPAAICRKVIDNELYGKDEMVIWGDGNQTRSFMYIDDCIKGIIEIMYSNIEEPVNLGSSEIVSINQLADIVENIAGYKLKRKYDLGAPKGVRGRNSENTLIKKYLGWEPSISLKDGLTKTFYWIKEQMIKDKEASAKTAGVKGHGHISEKEQLCNELGVEYLVLEGIPEAGLPPRSGSGSRRELHFPYRVCIAGGWIDQPWVSEIYPGSVVVAQLWPTNDFNDRSGMATSSRKVAIELWSGKIPEGDTVRNAQLLFGAENPPYSEYISGSQDQIGLLVPGINRLFYNGGFWPDKIDNCINPDICEWLSSVLHLIPLDPRPAGYNPLAEKNLKKSFVKELGESGNLCWESILKKDINGLGKAMTQSFLSWKKILPNTVPDWIMNEMETKYFPNYSGAITSGSGGGYVVIASEKEIEGAIKIKVKYQQIST